MQAPDPLFASSLIVGRDIIEQGLIKLGDNKNLKHATYDLTIGEIFPVGKDGYDERKKSDIVRYAIEPREAVWILSKEEFNLPATVTGLATLRTTYTKQGLVAFNVGIIDPFFKGPISTVLLNFSKRAVEIEKGDKFFRVLFHQHEDVSEYHRRDESVRRETYQKDLTSFARNDYSKNFLDIPDFDDDFYAGAATKLIFGILRRNKFWSFIGFCIFILPVVYVWTIPEYQVWFEAVKNAGYNLYIKIGLLFAAPSDVSP